MNEYLVNELSIMKMNEIRNRIELNAFQKTRFRTRGQSEAKQSLISLRTHIRDIPKHPHMLETIQKMILFCEISHQELLRNTDFM